MKSRVVISSRVAHAIETEASRSGRDPMACLELAWRAAYNRLSGLPPPAPLPQGFEVVPHIPDVEYVDRDAEQRFASRYASPDHVDWEIPLASWTLDLTECAFRLARSIGWVIERAWCVAELEAEARAAWLASELAGDTAPMTRI